MVGWGRKSLCGGGRELVVFGEKLDRNRESEGEAGEQEGEGFDGIDFVPFAV